MARIPSLAVPLAHIEATITALDMHDVVEHVQASTYQHGPFAGRVSVTVETRYDVDYDAPSRLGCALQGLPGLMKWSDESDRWLYTTWTGETEEPSDRAAAEWVVRISIPVEDWLADVSCANTDLTGDDRVRFASAQLAHAFHPHRIETSLVDGDLTLSDLGSCVEVGARPIPQEVSGGPEAAARALHRLSGSPTAWDRLPEHSRARYGEHARAVVNAYRGAW